MAEEGYTKAFQAKLVRVLYQDPDFAITMGPHLDKSVWDNKVHRFFAQKVIGYALEHLHGIKKDALRIEVAKAYRSGRLAKEKDETAVDAFLDRIGRKIKDATYVREQTFQFVKHQKIRLMMLEGLEHMKTGDYDAIDRSMNEVLAIQPAADAPHWMMRERKKRRKRRENYEPNGVPSGIKFDEHLKPGGLPPKQLGAVVAPPSGGKTSSLISFGRNAVLNGFSVLHITLELSKEVIQDRYDAALTDIPINDLEEGKNPRKIQKWWYNLGKTFDQEPLIIREWPGYTVTAKDIDREILLLERQGFYPGLIIVDYADLLVPAVRTRRSDSKWDDQGNVYVELRKTMQRRKLPCWTAAQGNRDSLAKDTIRMQDMAGSFEKPMHSDVLVALCQTEDEKLRRHGRIFIIKNRNGLADLSFPVRVNWACPSITNRK